MGRKVLHTLWILLYSRSGVTAVDRKHALPSVKDDWDAWLPQKKATVFDTYVQDLDRIYAMFSVALDESIELRHARLVTKSYRAVSMTPALCGRLSKHIGALLRALGEHAKHLSTVPNVALLNPANFRGSKEQRSARTSALLSRVLFTQRSQFLHKVSTLSDMSTEIGKDFRSAVEDLSSGGSTETESESDWQAVDVAHYDMNTCLREAIVLLKSFLLVLPDEQLAAFQRTVSSQMQAPEAPTTSAGERLLRARRMASVGGE